VPVQDRGVEHEESRLQRMLVLVGVLVLGFNLRPAAVSIGPVLPEVTKSLGLSDLEAGILTSLPVIAFGIFGAMAPALARTAGVHRVTLIALLAVVGGLLGRSLTGDSTAFLTLSVLALAGMATANVLLPSLVKLHFPDRVGLVTSLYTTALAIGLTSASALTVPISDAFGSWRYGLGVWALTAAVAAVPWLLLIRHDATPGAPTRSVSLSDVARTRLGWAMAFTFGLQSAQAYSMFGWFAQVYRDAGFSPTTAGLLLGVITGMSIPISLWAPAAAARAPDQRRLTLGLIACYPVGYLGLLLFPEQGAWLWAVLLGVAAGVFPVVLTLIGLRSRTPGGTAALSGFTQGVGYAVSVIGPFGTGVLYAATGSWTWPLLMLTVLAAGTAAFAAVVARPGYVEDELDRIHERAVASP
jgi:CP family cyanate transporter-like MFS transporter